MPQYKENMEMRMKHADAPERFMDSEVDLDEAVKRLLAVRTSTVHGPIYQLDLPTLYNGPHPWRTGFVTGLYLQA